MDSQQICKMIKQSAILKYKFRGVFPRDCIRKLSPSTFQIVNTDPLGEPGEHWLLIARYNQDSLTFYDSFGRPLQHDFSDIFARLDAIHPECQIKQFYPSASFEQPVNSALCGIYCIFLAQYIFSGALHPSSFPSFATEQDVLNFLYYNLGLPR